MSKPVILVTGANGQLGKELQVLAALYDDFDFVFTGRAELNIQEAEQVEQFFAKHQPAFCINCAAYTAVDKAETEKELAYLANSGATAILAEATHRHQSKFIHISTDYVFDGNSSIPYKENDRTNPLSVYGASKLEGEKLCLHHNPDAIIIRTSWVYSAFGNNFVKTMLRLMKDRPSINVVNDQIGSPTYAADLALCILTIILGKWQAGIYHYSNQGRISWYEFAEVIKEFTHSNCVVNPIPSSQYPTPVKRPAFSLLDTHKIRQTFDVEIPEWKDGLERCLQKLLTQ